MKALIVVFASLVCLFGISMAIRRMWKTNKEAHNIWDAMTKQEAIQIYIGQIIMILGAITLLLIIIFQIYK